MMRKMDGGTSRTDVLLLLSLLSSVLACVAAEQVHGMGTIKYVGVFIQPPSFETLEQRLRGRGTESEEQIQIRLATAKRELEFADSTKIFHVQIVNDDIEAAYAEFKQVALQAYNGIVPAM